ncbi:MAG: thiamine phosphate synthase [Firmicutes bacterium]|nr:thiamine phosphate synthase [Alicyclobacillaceae bacterium]MCL6497566.1 thiamine phosphate synthase [Bacillota bacterium]
MDLSLIVLVDPRQVAQDTVPELLSDLRRGGATAVQLRGKTSTTRELLAYGETMRAVTKALGMSLWVDDRLDVAWAIGADGLHVGQDDMPVEVVRRLVPGLRVGLSVGDPEELAYALAVRPDYLGVGPVYATRSKLDAGAPLGPDGFRALAAPAQAAGIPVVAIGGIEAATAAAVWAAGADGIAVIGAVMGQADKEAACRSLLAARGASR